MRGKPVSHQEEETFAGLIPAHAGKTLFLETIKLLPKAHPRACGENVLGGRFRFGDMGSSPRMRGKQGAFGAAGFGFGLIPAHAGKTLDAIELIFHARAHPRACGENSQTSLTLLATLGSSPRMRGKQVRVPCLQGRSRLIPAHAGKTGACLTAWVRRWAHPRACGENFAGDALGKVMDGSSPRMRGKLFSGIKNTLGNRLIPAHAGKTA